MRTKINISLFLSLLISVCTHYIIFGTEGPKDPSLFVAKTDKRNYGEELAQAAIAENYDELLAVFLDMANDFKMDPKEDVSILTFLSSIYFLRNEPEKVMELIKQYDDEKKNHPMFLYVSGTCHAIAGHHEQALSDFNGLVIEIEKNKMEYQSDYQRGFLKGISTAFFSCDRLEDFLAHCYGQKAFLNVILGNHPAAREDWKKNCDLSNRPDRIQSFNQCLDEMEQSPGTLKCVVEKNSKNNYVRLEERGILFSVRLKFGWERCACPESLNDAKTTESRRENGSN